MELFGIRIEFILFGLVLIGVALYHRHTFAVALAGLVVILAYKLGFTDYDFLQHLRHEGRLLINLFGLLMGFALLARHFEESRIADTMPRWLPDDWRGPFLLLWFVFVLSAFLDNIAGAIIGGSVAGIVFRKRVHLGFLAAIVAASNAGGAGSVLGATTTTMMWVAGIPAAKMMHAYVGSVAAMLVFGFFAARRQHAYQPIDRSTAHEARIDPLRVLVIVLIPIGAIVGNVAIDFTAAGLWAAILVGALICKTHWSALRTSLKGSLFLVALVLTASMMPVEALPPASIKTSLALGFISAVFDNIPLAKLALDQGGYDWGVLAYAVAFGGSMVWFGSSAGVAVSNDYPEVRSVGGWLRQGWMIIVAYVVGFFVLVGAMGWHP